MCLQTENEIVGEALIALLHDDLKSMSISSVGHRLTILKSVYDVKKAQDVPIESDHYVPLCKSASFAVSRSSTKVLLLFCILESSILTIHLQLPMLRLSTLPLH